MKESEVLCADCTALVITQVPPLIYKLLPVLVYIVPTMSQFASDARHCVTAHSLLVLNMVTLYFMFVYS
jgi:hypothetical protein